MPEAPGPTRDRRPCWRRRASAAISTSRRPLLQRVLSRAGGRRVLRAVDEVSFVDRARHHALAGRRIRLRQIHRRAARGRPVRAEPRRDALRGPAALGGPRAGVAAAAHEHDLPGPLRLAQSALAGARHRRRADPRLRHGEIGGRSARACRRAARAGRPGAGGRREISARVLRRPAPAHLDRARAVQRARFPGLRRADQRARRLRAGADPEPDARAAIAAAA